MSAQAAGAASVATLDRQPAVPLVKICGISRVEHARVAAEAGADFIGVVFYPPSIRNVSLEQARDVAMTARAASGGRTRVVGLFVDADVAAMNAAIEFVGLDLVQLSGNESPEVLAELRRPAIKSIRVDSSGRSDEEREFSRWCTARPAPFAIMVDAHVPGMYGGTGTVADWFVAAEFAVRYPVFLAGGLAPGNVRQAIQRVHPAVVDVSSGVETDGVKDPEKIRAFIRNAKQHPDSASGGGNDR